MEYDQRGRVAAVSVGARRGVLAWNDQDQLIAVTDPQERAVAFTYDAAGRVTSEVLPGQRSIGYSYDGNGNLTSITPPDRQAYLFAYSPVDLPTEFTAPGTAPTRYVYDRDRRLTRVIRPDQSTIDLSYANGRITTITTADRLVVPAYDAEGRVRAVNDTGGPDLAFTWDGHVPTSEAWTGEVSGLVSWGIDDHFRLSTETVNGSSVSFGYDGDSLLTAAGALTIGRDQGNGRIVSTAVGSIGETFGHDSFGERDRYAASTDGTEFFVIDYESDSLGRIVERRETRFGITSVETYGYDPAGRLETVHRDGTLAATYAYDANGNRTSVTAGDSATIGSYDAQDRLLTYGGATYTWTVSGELLSKSDTEGTTVYAYDAFGNLRTVALPDGRLIEYIIDAEDRRVGKKIDGVVVNRWLYSGDRIIAELDAAGAVRSRFVYGSRLNVPDYMTIGSATYRIIADHLGSVRYVVDAANGMVVQSARYDEWGNVVFDSNPGFQPFGFAGGLSDRDTGLVRFGARDYDPHVGRWTSKDPLGFNGGDTNLYAYVFSDPVNLIDPSGRDAITSDPHGLAIMASLFRRANAGLTSTERSALILQDPSTQKYLCFSLPWSAEQNRDTIPVIRHPWAVALIHTHPRGRTERADGGADPDAARTYGLPIYVLSRGGIHKFDAAAGPRNRRGRPRGVETTELDNNTYRRQNNSEWFTFSDADACGCR